MLLADKSIPLNSLRQASKGILPAGNFVPPKLELYINILVILVKSCFEKSRPSKLQLHIDKSFPCIASNDLDKSILAFVPSYLIS